jgi:hypothetical protein
MVTILPPKTDVGSAIGAGLGQGLGQGFAQGSQIGFQRNLLQGALQKAGEIAKDPNVSPLDRNLAFINAFAGIPGSERWLPQILPMMNQMAAFYQPSGGGGVSAGGGVGAPSIQGNPAGVDLRSGGEAPKIVGGQAVPEATEDAFPAEEVDLYEPYVGKGVKKYSHQEIQSVEYQDLNRGLPNSPRADFMRKQNQEIEATVDKISDRQQKFADYYSTLHPNADPDDQRVAKKFYRTKEALLAPTNEEKARVIDNYLDRFKALKANIANQAPRDLVDMSRDDQEKYLTGQIDWLLEEGQRDLAKEILTGPLKFGDAESERIIKKPTASQKDLLTKFPKLPPLSIEVPKFGKSAKYFQTRNEERNKKLDEYDKRLEKAVVPGTAKNPGTSLLVLRDLAAETGMTWYEFNDRISKLVQEGKIKLDGYQKQELAKLTSPPFSGLMDMFINRK